MELSIFEPVYYALIEGLGKVTVDLANDDVAVNMDFLLDSVNIPRGSAGFKWENDEEFSLQIANSVVEHDFSILLDESCCGKITSGLIFSNFRFSHLGPRSH